MADALAALGRAAWTAGTPGRDVDALLAGAEAQARRYLEWDLGVSGGRSANACVASAALFALCHVRNARLARAARARTQKAASDGERDSDDEGDGAAKKAAEAARKRAKLDAMAFPRTYVDDATNPPAVRATATRLALAVGAAPSTAADAFVWAVRALDAPGAAGYLRDRGGDALKDFTLGETARRVGRPGDALSLPCGLDLDEGLLMASPLRANGPLEGDEKQAESVRKGGKAKAAIDEARKPGGVCLWPRRRRDPPPRMIHAAGRGVAAIRPRTMP